jgi:hypothetical protein
MKTAILISGAMRSFDKCLPAMAWHVFRHFPDADFYVATANDEDAWKVKLLRDKYGDLVKDGLAFTQPVFELPAGCPPNWTQGQFYMHEPYFISVSPQAILGQLWLLEKAWLLVTANNNYECIIRIRPDIYFHSLELPWLTHPKYKTFYLENHESTAYVPWWGRFGGVNDRFAIMGWDAAEAYFRTFSYVHRLIEGGCPLHPESLIKTNLEASGCRIRSTLQAMFSTLRINGEMRPPEISNVDIANFAAFPG